MSEMPKGVPEPNYTQIPNVLLDEFMAVAGNAEFRVVMAIARSTFGWHKDCDCVSLTQLEEATGLSRPGVENGLKAALARGILIRRAKGKSFEYCLRFAPPADAASVNVVNQSSVNVVNQSDDGSVNVVNTQNKETDLNKEERNISAAKPARRKHKEPSPYKAHPAVALWHAWVDFNAPREKWSALNEKNMALVAVGIGEEERWLRAFEAVLDWWRKSGWSLGNVAGFMEVMRHWSEATPMFGEANAPWIRNGFVQSVGQDRRAADRNPEVDPNSDWAREMKRRAGGR